jgi:drug/metabolite transporter (DMT)-like permease
MLLLSTAFWAVSFPAMKALVLSQQQILPGAGSWFISSLCVLCRFLLAGLLLFPFAFKELKSVSRREMEQGLCLAFFASTGMCLQMDGLAYVPASTSAFLTQLYCVLIPLWVALRRRRWPAVKILFCSALVLTGMALLVQLNLRALRLGRGEMETLAASMMFAAQILWLEHPRYAGNRPLCLTSVMLLAMGLFAVPLVLATAPSAAACWQLYRPLPIDGLLLILMLVCSLAPFLLMNRWQREVTATEAGLVYCTEPVFASVFALFLPAWLSSGSGAVYANEHVTARLLCGGGLITAANVMLQSPWWEAKRPPA